MKQEVVVDEEIQQPEIRSIPDLEFVEIDVKTETFRSDIKNST